MKIRQRNTVRDNINAICGIAVILLGFPLYHLGIGDDAAGAAGKERPLQLEGILVFGIEPPESAAQERRSGIAALHPGLMDAVAGAINIALPDSLETQKEIAMVVWGDFLQLIRKMVCRLPPADA